MASLRDFIETVGMVFCITQLTPFVLKIATTSGLAALAKLRACIIYGFYIAASASKYAVVQFREGAHSLPLAFSQTEIPTSHAVDLLSTPSPTPAVPMEHEMSPRDPPAFTQPARMLMTFAICAFLWAAFCPWPREIAVGFAPSQLNNKEQQPGANATAKGPSTARIVRNLIRMANYTQEKCKKLAEQDVEISNLQKQKLDLESELAQERVSLSAEKEACMQELQEINSEIRDIWELAFSNACERDQDNTMVLDSIKRYNRLLQNQAKEAQRASAILNDERYKRIQEEASLVSQSLLLRTENLRLQNEVHRLHGQMVELGEGRLRDLESKAKTPENVEEVERLKEMMVKLRMESEARGSEGKSDVVDQDSAVVKAEEGVKAVLADAEQTFLEDGSTKVIDSKAQSKDVENRENDLSVSSGTNSALSPPSHNVEETASNGEVEASGTITVESAPVESNLGGGKLNTAEEHTVTSKVSGYSFSSSEPPSTEVNTIQTGVGAALIIGKGSPIISFDWASDVEVLFASMEAQSPVAEDTEVPTVRLPIDSKALPSPYFPDGETKTPKPVTTTEPLEHELDSPRLNLPSLKPVEPEPVFDPEPEPQLPTPRLPVPRLPIPKVPNPRDKLHLAMPAGSKKPSITAHHARYSRWQYGLKSLRDSR